MDPKEEGFPRRSAKSAKIPAIPLWISAKPSGDAAALGEWSEDPFAFPCTSGAVLAWAVEA
jgi:hypothetical protein